jgi:SAM-dependent methyltransferase
MIQEENRKLWEEKADHFVGHQVSWWDVNMKKIEVNTVSGLLSREDYVLDVGCSNGASTIDLQKLTGARFLGIDYSERAIAQAKKHETPALRFECADVRELDRREVFDKAISIRALINVMDPADQRRSLEAIHRALKPGGIYVMCEAFSGAHANLNRARALFGLDPLPVPAYNRYFNEEEMDSLVDGLFHIQQIIRHSSLYYIGTRVFQYMSLDSEPSGSDTTLHRFFRDYGRETARSGDFGPNKVYVLQKY